MNRLGRIQHKQRIALACVLVLGLALRVLGIGWGLHDATVERRPHPDEWAIYWLLQWFVSDRNLNPCPRPALGGCFFDWGSTYLYMTYAFHLLGSPLLALVPADTFGRRANLEFVYSVLFGRVLSVLASTLAAFIVYRFASRAYGTFAGIVACLFVTLSALLIQLAHFATPDSTTIALECASLLSLYVAMEKPGAVRFAIAGAITGVAIGTEANMVVLGVPALAAIVMSRRGSAFSLWESVTGFFLPLLAALIAAYALTNPYVFIDLPAFLLQMRHGALIRTTEAQLHYRQMFSSYGPIWLYVLRYSLGYGLGLPMTCAAVAGLCFAAKRRRRSDLLLLAWIVPYFLLVTLTPAKFMRYSAPLIPPLAILAGALAAQWTQRARRYARMSGAVAVAFVFTYSFTYDLAYASLFAEPESRSVATAWLSHHARSPASVSFGSLPNGLINLPYFMASPQYRLCFSSFRQRTLKGRADFLVVDDYDVETHPSTPSWVVREFETALGRSRAYKRVFHISPQPSAFGFTFPITMSPHDWRYPSHTISIYRRAVPALAGFNRCFGTLEEAQRALYRKPLPYELAVSRPSHEAGQGATPLTRRLDPLQGAAGS